MKGGKRINAILSQKEQKRLRDLGMLWRVEELLVPDEDAEFLFGILENENQLYERGRRIS